MINLSTYHFQEAIQTSPGLQERLMAQAPADSTVTYNIEYLFESIEDYNALVNNPEHPDSFLLRYHAARLVVICSRQLLQSFCFGRKLRFPPLLLSKIIKDPEDM